MMHLLTQKATSAAILAASLFLCHLPCGAQNSSDAYPAAAGANAHPQASSPQSNSAQYESPAGINVPQSPADAESVRKVYASKIRENYNFRFGTDTISTPGNAKVAGDDFIQPGAFPTQNIAPNVTKKRTRSGGRRCTQTHSGRRFTARASIFLRARRASSLRAIATVATIPSGFCRAH